MNYLMKHISIKNVSTLRHTPNDSQINRCGSPDLNHEIYQKPGRGFKKLFTYPRGKERFTYSGKVYPNGEFTIGYVPPSKKRLDDSRYERGEVGGIKGISPENDFVELTKGDLLIPHSERTMSSLALSTPQNHHTARRFYGRNGITPFAKRVVRNASDFIQNKFGRKNVGFFTLTLPDYPLVIRRSIAANWGELQRKYFQALRRFHDKHKYPYLYVAVTEIQSKRWKETGNPGLHIHYCTPVFKLSRQPGDYFVTADWIRETWRRTLQNHIDAIPLDGVEYETETPRIDCQRVKSSASAYLSKYMSKGGALICEVAEDEGEECIPHQWWSASLCLRRWIYQHTSALSQDQIKYLLQICQSLEVKGLLYASMMYKHLVHRGEVCIAISGKLEVDLRYLRRHIINDS